MLNNIWKKEEKLIKDPHLKVSELIKLLQDCRPDAEVFHCCYFTSTWLNKIRNIKNCGNHVLLCTEES